MSFYYRIVTVYITVIFLQDNRGFPCNCFNLNDKPYEPRPLCKEITSESKVEEQVVKDSEQKLKKIDNTIEEINLNRTGSTLSDLKNNLPVHLLSI